VSSVPDAPRSRSVIGHSLSLAPAAIVQVTNEDDEDEHHNNSLQQERDPLELVTASLSNSLSAQLVDLTDETEDGLYSGVDPDENFSGSDAIYANSNRVRSGMEDHNGWYL